MYTKISFLSILTVLALSFASCKKDKKNDTIPSSTDQTYSSTENFYKKNGVKLQTYFINASSGGTFTTPKGTHVTIPANCFVKGNNSIVSGNVIIQFKDIYSKSDMLLSDVGTTFINGAPMVSGGEFFINALQGDSALQIDSGKFIAIEQPFLDGEVRDTAMEAMIMIDPKDSIQGGNNGGWSISPGDTLLYNTTNYVFNLYQFSGNNGGGTWCNSDNPYYFSAFSTTTLTVNKPSGFNDLDVFLVFKNVNSMVHVYSDGTNFPYNYSPVGQECTVVVIGVKDDKLYASFSPVTITSNLSVNPSLTETTTDNFKAILNSLN